MEVILQKVTRRYGREVIFRNVDHTFASGGRTAILGPNGSGKSTLLQLIGGALAPTEGTVTHSCNGSTVPVEDVYRYISIASPYLGLYEDLSLEQTIQFHARFKPLKPGISPVDAARIAYLDHALAKPVMQFSSGMKQRLKLALAILSDTPLLLLDEPTSNLDTQAIEWYGGLLGAYQQGRTVLIASNRVAHEYDICTQTIEMEALKG